MGGVFISHIFFSLIGYVSIATTVFACRPDKSNIKNNSLSCALPRSEFINGNYSAHKAYQAPTIDGEDKENSWAFANWASISSDERIDTICDGLKYKFTWNQEAIYILIEVDSIRNPSSLHLKIDGLTIPLIKSNIPMFKKGKFIERKISMNGLKKEITLPIQFISLCKEKEYIGRQGYLKLVL